MWEAFNYCEVFAGRFSAEECQRVIAAHQLQSALQSRIPGRDRGLIRDSDLFWVPRMTETEWIFDRIRDVAARDPKGFAAWLQDPTAAPHGGGGVLGEACVERLRVGLLGQEQAEQPD